MGLDMYAFKIKAVGINDVNLKNADEFNEFISKISNDEDYLKNKKEIHYWRKHPDLHGYMEEIYNKRGGEEEFNCVNVALTKDDLIQLEGEIEKMKLPKTSGFFFGSSSYDENSINQDLEFIKKAKDAIEKGYVVYYTSWW